MSRNIKALREWQVKAVQRGRLAPRFLCQAPGGSGKSFVQVLLAQADIEACGNKQLILVPRNHIHHTFWDGEEITFRLPASDHISQWRVGLNLCLKSDCTRLKRWLLAEPDAHCLVAITTHSAMVLVWKGLSKEEKRRALRRITFRIDEAHHISHVFHEADLELFNCKDQEAILADGTALGKVVNYILKVNDPTVKLHLTTATFFRGDKKTILSKAFQHAFVPFNLPWDEHFETLGIENLVFDFINYDGELKRSFHGVDGVLNRTYGTTLKAEVVKVLGEKHDGFVEQVHEVIRTYWERGIVLTSGFGLIPEMAMTANAVESRLRLYFKTSITAERDKLLGLSAHELIMPVAKVKEVIAQYARKGVRITAETKYIPELGIAGSGLDCRLLNWYGIRLPDLVNQVVDEMNIPLTRRIRDTADLSVAKIKRVVKDYSRRGIKITEHTGRLPELGASSGTVCKFLRKKGIKIADLR